jgi:hypothetical protein
MANRKLELDINVLVRNIKRLDELEKRLKTLVGQAKALEGIDLGKDSANDLRAFYEAVGDINARLKAVEGQFKKTGKAADDFGDQAEKGGKKAGLSVERLALGFMGVVEAIKLATASASQFYASTIGANERLNQLILKSASSVAATNQIFAAGVAVEDPTAKIKALQGPIKDSIAELEIATRDLVGVTSQEVNEVFGILLNNAGQLTGQSEEFNDSLESSVALSRGLVASLGTIGIPLDQARQEIQSIIQGQITSDSLLAKNLGLTNQQVQRWRAQGVLVDELSKKFETFVAGNALAANSISGVSSNIQDIIEVVARSAGEPLLDPIVKQLKIVFDFLAENQDAIGEFLQTAVTQIVRLGESIIKILSPVTDLSDESEDFAKTLLDGLEAIAEIVEVLEPFLQATVQQFVDGLEIITAGVNAIRNGIALLGRGFEDTNAALDEFGRQIDARKAQATGLLDEIRNTNDISEKSQKRLSTRTQLTIEQNQELIKEIKALVPPSGKLRDEQEKQIQSLEELNERLLKNEEALKFTREGVRITSPALVELGSSFDQLAAKAENALNVLAQDASGKLDQATRTAKELIDITTQELELGRISSEEAIARFETVATNTKLELDTQQKAIKGIRNTQKQSSQDRLAEIQTETSVLESEIATQSAATVAQTQKLTKLRQDATRARIEDNREAIRQEQELIAAGTGSERTLKQLQQEQRTLAGELKKVAVQGERDLQAARLKEIERAQLEVAKLQLESQREIILQEQAFREQRANDASITEGQINAEITRLNAEANAERLAQDIDFQRQRVNATREGSEDRIKEENKLFQLITQETQAVISLEKARQDQAAAAIETQIQDEQRLQQSEQKRLQLRQEIENRIAQSLDQQFQLFQGQLDLLTSRNSLLTAIGQAEISDAERALAIRKEISENQALTGKQRRQLEQELRQLGFNRFDSEAKISKEIFELKKEQLESEAEQLQQRQIAERATLEFENQKAELQAQQEIRAEQNRVRELEFQRTLLALEAQKAQARGDARAEAIAVEGATQLSQAIAEAQEGVQVARDNATNVNRLNELRAQSLSAKQATEALATARSIRDQAQVLAREFVDETGISNQASQFAERSSQEVSRIENEASATAARLDAISAQEGARKLENARLFAESQSQVNQELEKQLAFEQQLNAEIARRISLFEQLKESMDGASVPLEGMPGRLVGGPVTGGAAYHTHAGESFVPGASTASQALAMAGGAGYLRGEGVFIPPTGGYVLNAGDTQAVIHGFGPRLNGGPGIPMNLKLGAGGPEAAIGRLFGGMDLSKLENTGATQTELLRQMVSLGVEAELDRRHQGFYN